MKFIKSLTTLLVTVLCILFSNNDANAQMRQVYTDNTQPVNEIFKLSFYTPAQGYVAFRDWIGFTTDSGRTFAKKYITLANVNLNGYSINSILVMASGGVWRLMRYASS